MEEKNNPEKQELKDTKEGILAQGSNHHPLIDLRQIVKIFKNAAGEFVVLKGIDAQFYRGEFVGIIGKSGSGKSTLINMITGIDRPTSGEVWIGGTAVHGLTENQMAAWRGRNVGIVFQFFQLLPTLTLLENIMLPMDFCNMYSPRERKERAMELLSMVDMQDHAQKLPSAISGGQQQRVAIARALSNDPPIIIADEPTGNLDSKTAEAIFLMFENLVKEGKTIVMVTHDSSMARRVSRTLLIADGEIVNEWVARALPTLNHQQMLEASRHLETVEFSPGQTLIQENEHADRFYIITEGYVEVALKRSSGIHVMVERLGPGDYVGEIELMRDNRAIATVLAAELPVKAVALTRETFINLMSESDETRKAMEYLVSSRQEQNLSMRNEHNPVGKFPRQGSKEEI